MATQYGIDFVNRIIRTRLTGVITHADYAGHLRKLATDPAFDPTFSELVQFGEPPLEIHLSFMAFSSGRDPFSTTSNRAIVAPPEQEAVYGIARMFQLAKDERPNIRIFPTTADAEEWLGVR
jgi:hypothetical protein